jgi:hypothetical protein
LLRGNVLLLRRIGGRDLNGHKSISIGRMSSGMKSFGVMKLGHNQGGILAFGLLAEIMGKSTQIVWYRGIKGR